ncbi:MAG: adenine deaminase [Paracoccaceae bacterium]|nr:adenine deaminase [Paracoccaceae bacterium]
MSTLRREISCGKGDEVADIVLRGGKIFDLITGELLEGDVAIVGKTIVGTCDHYNANKIIDVSGLTLVPGFIDTHLHIESSMLTPFEFDRCVTPRGVTTAICDPHEIANVIGLDGIKYFQRASEFTLMDIKVQLSSCVPSTDMETSGANITAAELKSVMNHSSGIGLAEFMNYPGVINGDPEVINKLNLFHSKHIDGHAPLLSGTELNAYITAGISTEHEATTASEALEKLKKGMRILIREGSVSKDLDALAEILTERTSPYICLCTDDRNPLDIAEYGHIDYMIRKLISKGISPLAVYRAASISGAEAFGLKDRGLISPGKRADIVALSDLEECNIKLVVCGGKPIDKESFLTRKTLPPVARNSVNPPTIYTTSFCTSETTEETNVIGIIEGKILTDHLKENISIVNGDKLPDISRDLLRVTVIERHGKNGNVSNGFVKGFGLKSGAIASTVCHDHHNIISVGTNYADMELAIKHLSKIEGGFVIASEGKILAELALPIAGLMSLQPFELVQSQLSKLRRIAKNLGVTLEEPFLQLAFLALPVIPNLKITDKGLVDVNKFKLI